MAAGTNDQWWHEHQGEPQGESVAAAAAAESERPEDPPSRSSSHRDEQPPERRMEDMLVALRSTRETMERLASELEHTEHDLHEWNAERLAQEAQQQKLRSEPLAMGSTSFTSLDSIPWHLKVQCYIEFWDKFLHQLSPSRQHSHNVAALSLFASNVWGETHLSPQEIYRTGPIMLFHDVLPLEQDEVPESNNVLNLMATQQQQKQLQLQARRTLEVARPPTISAKTALASKAPTAPVAKAPAPKVSVPVPNASAVAPAQRASTPVLTPSPAPKTCPTPRIPAAAAPKVPAQVPKLQVPASRPAAPKIPAVSVKKVSVVTPRTPATEAPRPQAPTPKAAPPKAPTPKALSPKAVVSSSKTAAPKAPAPVTTSMLSSVSYETVSTKMPTSPGGWKRVKLRIRRNVPPVLIRPKNTNVMRLYSRSSRPIPSVTPSSESSRGSSPRSLSPSRRLRKERIREAMRAKLQPAKYFALSSSEEEDDKEQTVTDLTLLPPEIAKLRQQILLAIKPFCEEASTVRWPFRALRFPSEFLFYDADEHPQLARDHERFWSTYSPVYLEYVYHHPADVNERRRIATGKANLLRAQQKLLSNCIEAVGIQEVAKSFTNKYASNVFFFVKDYLSLDRLTPTQLKTHLESVCEPWGSPVVSNRIVSWWEMLLRRERGQSAHFRVNIGVSSHVKELIAAAHFNGELQFDEKWVGLCCLEPWKSMLDLHFVDHSHSQGQKRPLDQAKKLRVKRSEQYDSDNSFSADSRTNDEDRTLLTQLRRAKGRYKRMRGTE